MNLRRTASCTGRKCIGRQQFYRHNAGDVYTSASPSRALLPVIGQIVAGKRAITPDTASRLARNFGTDAQSWLNWQAHYDLQVAQQSLEAKIKRDVQPMKVAA